MQGLNEREAGLLFILLDNANKSRVIDDVNKFLKTELSIHTKKALIFYRNSVANGNITEQNYSQKAEELLASKIAYKVTVGGAMQFHVRERELIRKQEECKEMRSFLERNDSLMMEAGRRGLLDKYVPHMSKTPPYGV